MHKIWNLLTVLVFCAVLCPGLSAADSANKELTKLKKELTQLGPSCANQPTEIEQPATGGAGGTH